MSFRRRIADLVADALAFGLRLGGRQSYQYFVDALWQRYPGNTAPTLTVLPCRMEYVAPDPQDRPLVERIFVAYERASSQQQALSTVFQPSGMWQNNLRAAYTELTESLANRDLDRFHQFLANFGSWKVPTGIEESWLLTQCSTSPEKKRHVEEKLILPLVNWWLRLESNGRDLSALEIPRHGNLGGMWVDDHLISPGSVFSEIHGRLLSQFIDAARPVIGELGGGFGRLFYFLSQHLKQFCYLAFDLPEVLCLASYYLMKSFPDKRFLLYGEDNWDSRSLTEYDFLLLPAFEISKVPDNSIDLFINLNSLGEFEANACRYYVTEICRSAQAFWHCNHESTRFTYSDGTTSLLNREYPIPRDKFHQVARYCNAESLIRADRFNNQSDMFWYYFRSSSQTMPATKPEARH